MIEKILNELLSNYPHILHGYCSIEYSDFSSEFQSALVLAVPYGGQLTLSNYKEQAFEDGIGQAREQINSLIPEIEQLLQAQGIHYYIPPVAQKNETELVAPFSFKYAAAKSGIGWYGKNDVIITERYGPRIRLSAILIDEVFHYGKSFTECQCPNDCNLCVSICPHHALKDTRWNVNTHREDIINYQLCNEKRSLFIKNHGRKSSCGLCLAICPYGQN